MKRATAHASCHRKNRHDRTQRLRSSPCRGKKRWGAMYRLAVTGLHASKQKARAKPRSEVGTGNETGRGYGGRVSKRSHAKNRHGQTLTRAMIFALKNLLCKHLK